MTNPEFITMIERFHKPAQNVKIKAVYLLAGATLFTIAFIAVKATIEKSNEIQQLKADSSRKNETISSLTSKNNMLEYDQSLHLSIIETLTAEKKVLNDKLKADTNVEKS
jgi:hypothetical protein